MQCYNGVLQYLLYYCFEFDLIGYRSYSVNHYYIKLLLFSKLFFLTCNVKKYGFIKYLMICNYFNFISVRIWFHRIFLFPIATWSQGV